VAKWPRTGATGSISPTTGLRDLAGCVAGWLASPLFAVLAAARQARVFHPDGVVLAARVEPAEADDAHARSVGEGLRGHALVRFSTALWRGQREWPDALGCAVRFRASAQPSAEPGPGDQDLLFATIRSPFTTLLGPIGTRVHDFLANTYFATAPFEVRGVGRVKWRLVPERPGVVPRRTAPSPAGVDRCGRLMAAVARGEATLRLDMRHVFRREWSPVARIRLERAVSLDQDQLRFWPFRDGRGIAPRGFVQGLWRGAYRASQTIGRRGAGLPRRSRPS
jgi:hypothetical protein